MSFFPLDREILSSSIWAQNPPADLKVWLYLLLTADIRTGIVPDTDPAIALRCGLQLDEVTSALERFAAPDAFSRTETKEGRRIERVNGRVRLVNYKKHARKDYSTPRVQRLRMKRSETNGNGETVSSLPKTTDTDTDTDTVNPKALANTKHRVMSADKPPTPRPKRFWWDEERKRIWGTDEARAKLKATWKNHNLSDEEIQTQLKALDRWLEMRPEKRRENSNFANRINNWLNTYLMRQEEKAVE